MEKSSAVVLSKEEKAIIKGNSDLVKTAGETDNKEIPTRFKGWYSHNELKDIINEQD